jgi:hypothetical protein
LGAGRFRIIARGGDSLDASRSVFNADSEDLESSAAACAVRGWDLAVAAREPGEGMTDEDDELKPDLAEDTCGRGRGCARDGDAEAVVRPDVKARNLASLSCKDGFTTTGLLLLLPAACEPDRPGTRRVGL